MKRSDELKQQRGNKMDELTAISATAANGMLNDEQRSKALGLKTEIQNLDIDIELAEQAEAEQARSKIPRTKSRWPLLPYAGYLPGRCWQTA